MNVDYVPIAEPVILAFSGDSRFLCTNISILPDDIVERNEILTITLDSNDSAVSIAQPTATVLLVDSDEGRVASAFLQFL